MKQQRNNNKTKYQSLPGQVIFSHKTNHFSENQLQRQPQTSLRDFLSGGTSPLLRHSDKENSGNL